MYHNFFLYSSVVGHLGCFHVLAIVNTAAVSIGVHLSFRTVVFSEYMLSNGIAERFIPSLLRNIHTVFQNGYINLHPHQQCGGFHILCSIYCL